MFSRPLLAAAAVLAAGLSAPGQPAPKTPPPAKPPAATGPDDAKFSVTGPVTIGSLPPVDPLTPPSPVPVSPVVLTKYGLTLLVVVGTDTEKTALIAQVPLGVAADFQRKYVAANGWVEAAKSPVFGMAGRLTVEDEPGLYPTGAAPILTDVPAFQLGRSGGWCWSSRRSRRSAGSARTSTRRRGRWRSRAARPTRRRI